MTPFLPTSSLPLLLPAPSIPSNQYLFGPRLASIGSLRTDAHPLIFLDQDNQAVRRGRALSETKDTLIALTPLRSTMMMAFSKPIEPTFVTSSVSSSSCPLLKKLPMELRIMIYGLVLAAPNDELGCTDTVGKERHIRWQPRYASDAVHPSSIESHRQSRVRSGIKVDTALFEVCKQIYEEAHPQLISKSTVLLEMIDVKTAYRCPLLLANLRRVIVKDFRNSFGQQVARRWTSSESLAAPRRKTTGVIHLRHIRSLLKRAPLLSLTISFEVLYLTIRYEWETRSSTSQYPLFASELERLAVESGFDHFNCVDVGRWWTRFQSVELVHYKAVESYQRFVRNPCECADDFVQFMATQPGVYRNFEVYEFNIDRHNAAAAGILGEEGLRRCGGTQLVEAKGVLEATWEMLYRYIS